MSDTDRQIAKVERALLGWEDHGILTCWLHLSYGGSGQGAGGYALDAWHEDEKRRVGTAYGMEFVARLMKACGVDDWSKVVGRTVFAVIDGGMVRGIEPLPTEPGEPFMFASLAQLAEADQ